MSPKSQGLTLFNFGLLYGLMPIGKTLGLRLPRALSTPPLLAVAGLLGESLALSYTEYVGAHE